MKVAFVCKKCGKEFRVQADIFESKYKGQELCLTCRLKEKQDGGYAT
nr:hypothetical protein [uncultured Anaeromusa sp.]